MGPKKLNPQKLCYIAIAVIVVGVLLVIAGAVMLGIGITKLNESSKCNDV
jgi:hypothetical protein